MNVFVFIPTVAQFHDYSENLRLNPAAFFDECSILVVVNTAETQAAEKAIKKEIEHSPVRINKVNIHRAMWTRISVNAKVTDTQRH